MRWPTMWRWSAPATRHRADRDLKIKDGGVHALTDEPALPGLQTGRRCQACACISPGARWSLTHGVPALWYHAAHRKVSSHTSSRVANGADCPASECW